MYFIDVFGSERTFHPSAQQGIQNETSILRKKSRHSLLTDIPSNLSGAEIALT